jgi:hypothetical protein
MSTDSTTLHLGHLVRDVSARAVTAVGLAGIGLIHLLDSIGKYGETRYIFWLYVALIAGSLVTAAAVLFSRSRVWFAAAAVLAASAAIGFVLSRTTGLPNASGDVGNWTEPLGLASLFVEGVVVAVATGACFLPAAEQAERVAVRTETDTGPLLRQAA